MSTDPDDDSALAALWREHSTEAPPPHVDAAILAAAHRAVASAPHGHERWLGPRAWRWWMPLAAAAVIAVVFVGVKPPSQTLVDDAVQLATDMPAAPAEKQVATSAPVVPPAAPPAVPPVVTSPRTEAAPATIAPLPQGAPAAPDTRTSREGGKLGAERVQAFAASPPARAAESNAAPAKPASPGKAASAASSAAPTQQASRAAQDRVAALEVEAWFARIRAMRDLGREDEAVRELARFRAAYPNADTRLPADLREWAKQLPR